VRQVAAFDFDGTITRRDTLAGFLAHVGGRRRLVRSMAVDTVAMVRGTRDDAVRDATKERILGRVLRGRSDTELWRSGAEYARSLPDRFRVETVERLRWHQRQGHETIIVSASLVYYLRPVAQHLGIDAVLGVEMEADAAGRLTGRLAGPNLRAAEKPQRLGAWLAATHPDEPGRAADVELWAYGNSSGDEALLSMADHPTWVGSRADRRS
jgi:phosphatidylglycerophosphatase C